MVFPAPPSLLAIRYELEAVAEPPFASWDAMLQRLRATNLLPAHAGPSNVGARRAASAYVCIIECDGPNAMPTASLAALTALKVAAISDAHGTSQGRRDDDDTDEARCETRWALLEGVCTGGRASDRYADAVLLGVPSWIVDGPAPDTALALAMPAAAPNKKNTTRESNPGLSPH